MTRKTRGAVSVFLVIILVPCMLVSSIFVDLSRAKLAQTVAESSSDLVLNSLLTQYDADLEDWYGMMASCQSIDEVYEKTGEIFARILASQDLSDAEIKSIYNDVSHTLTDSGKINDLLQMEVQGDVQVSEVKNANLTNPTILKDQVVEFMKYRGPVELSKSVVGRLLESGTNAFEGISDLIDSDENEDLVKSKQKFYEIEGDFCEKAFRTYVAIGDYYFPAMKLGMNNAKLKTYADQLGTYRDLYKEIHTLMVRNLYNTNNLTGYTRPAADASQVMFHFKDDNGNGAQTFEQVTKTYRKNDNPRNFETYICTGEEEADGETRHCVSKKQVESLYQEMLDAQEKFKTAKQEFINATADLMNHRPDKGGDPYYDVQWWVRMNKVVYSYNGKNPTEVLKDACEDYARAYAKLLALEDCEGDETLDDDWKDRFVYNGKTYCYNDDNDFTTATRIKKNAKDYIDKYMKLGASPNGDPYMEAVCLLEQVSRNCADKINPDKLKMETALPGEQGTCTVSEGVRKIKGKLEAMRAELQEYVDALEIAINGDGDKIVSLDQLLTLANQYDTALDTYTSEAEGTDTDFGREEVGYLNEAGVKWREEVTAENVAELKTRLTNIKSQYQKVIAAIDSLQYGGRKLMEIPDYATMKSLSGAKVDSGKIPARKSELDQYAAQTFGELILPAMGKRVITLEHLDDFAYNVDINPEKNNTVHTPKIYVAFHELWKGKSIQDLDEVKKDQKDTEEKSKKYVDEQKGVASKYRGDGKDISRVYSSAGSFGFGEVINSLVGFFTKLINGNFDQMRDDIYVTAYAMNMFSYATYDREGMYSMLSEDQRKDMDLTNITDSNLYDETYYGSVKDRWASAEMKDSEGNVIPNKTMTNKLINNTNNRAYLAEIEYLLYGEAGDGSSAKANEKNLKTSFTKIYELRLVLNLISGFQHFWSLNDDVLISTVASGLSTATLGIVPAPVFKAVIITLMAAIETALDNQRLSAGMPVELYKKSKEEWWTCVWSADMDGTDDGFSGFFTRLTSGDAFKKKNQDKGLFYSDYLTCFLYFSLTGSKAENTYKRLAELVQDNLRIHENVSSDFSMKNARVYFKLDATVRVKPTMVTLPIFGNEGDPMAQAKDWCTFEVNTVRGYS